ncbi:hypothetical protein E4T39_04706 [Aureobasidium subglaciale]|nr:hypothetical protein E4T39_04706 [Aureobasidium subglaciale]
MKLTTFTLGLLSSAAYVSAKAADSTLASMAKAYALHNETRAAFTTNLTTTLANVPPSLIAAFMAELTTSIAKGNPYCTDVEASWCRGSRPPAWCDLCGDLGKRSLDSTNISSITDLDSALENMPPFMSAVLMTEFAVSIASGNPRCTDVEASCNDIPTPDPMVAAAAAVLLPRHHPDGKCHVKEIEKCEKKIR